MTRLDQLGRAIVAMGEAQVELARANQLRPNRPDDQISATIEAELIGLGASLRRLLDAERIERTR